MKKDKKTFAQRAKDIVKKYPRHEWDALEKEELNRELQKLQEEQELIRNANGLNDNVKSFPYGGPIDSLNRSGNFVLPDDEHLAKWLDLYQTDQYKPVSKAEDFYPLRDMAKNNLFTFPATADTTFSKMPTYGLKHPYGMPSLDELNEVPEIPYRDIYTDPNDYEIPSYVDEYFANKNTKVTDNVVSPDASININKSTPLPLRIAPNGLPIFTQTGLGIESINLAPDYTKNINTTPELTNISNIQSEDNFELTPYKSSILPSLISGGISTLGNLGLALGSGEEPEKISLGRVSPIEISLSRARDAIKREADLQARMAGEITRKTAGTRGEYLSNLAATRSGIQRESGKQLSNLYEKEELANLSAKEKAMYKNVDLQAQEELANINAAEAAKRRKEGYISAALSSIGETVGDITKTRSYDKFLESQATDNFFTSGYTDKITGQKGKGLFVRDENGRLVLKRKIG